MVRESYSLQQAKIKKEIDKLQKRAEALQERRRKPVLVEIVRTMREYAITPEEIAAVFGKAPVKARAGAVSRRGARAGGVKKPIPPKYRHPQTGNTWTGRGKPPRWLSDAEAAGTSRQTFLIAAAPEAA